MRKIPILIAAVVLAALVIVPVQAQQIPAAQPNTCGLASPAFCETFDLKGGGGPRNGDLPEYWGVSRMRGQGSNPGQGQYNSWADTDLVLCNGTQKVAAPRDVQICNGQLREASNDYGDVTVLAMYPKQPFDFAGRTGTVAFDVTNDSIGMHTSWPELWVTDQPVPVPFTHLVSWKATPRYGFGLRFGAATEPGHGGNLGPNCPSDNNRRWTVDSISVSRNYVIDDSTDAGHTTNVTPTGCVIASSGPNGGMNHIETRVSESRIEVWATDAGQTQLKQIAVIDNARLGFTRGLIWIQDAHYNAVKFGGTAEHTFTWDNVGFDGPLVDRDITFDEPDGTTRVGGQPLTNLGYMVQSNQRHTLNLPPLYATGQAVRAYLLASWFTEQTPATLTYVVNGTGHTIPYPFDNNGWTQRTYAFPIPLGELHDGANTLSLGGSGAMIVSNLGVIVANVPQGGAPVPTPTATSAVPTATVPAAATATALPASTATPVTTATTVAAPGCYIQVSIDGVNWRPRRVDNVSMAALLCGRS